MIQNLFFFFFFRGVGSLSQPRLNIFTVGNMRVMICLGQGGLRSLSASSFDCIHFAQCFLLHTAENIDADKKNHVLYVSNPTTPKAPYPPYNENANHLYGVGGHAKFLGHKHLLNTMSDLHWDSTDVFDLAIWHAHLFPPC